MHNRCFIMDIIYVNVVMYIAFTKILYHADMRLTNTEIFSFWKLFVPMIFICCFSLTENICTREYDDEFQIALVGDRGVGKTQIIKQFTNVVLDKAYTPTMSETVVDTYFTVYNKTFRICIYDLPGDIDDIAAYETIFKKVNVILVVYDITNEHSFNNCENWVETVRSMMTCNQAALILIGNKADSNDTLRVIASNNAENRAFFQGYGFTAQDNKQLLYFFEVSANNHVEIEKLFEEIIMHLMSNKTPSGQAVVEEPLSVKNIETQNNKKCCCFCYIF